MNILVLHALGNPRKWLHSVATFELGMPNFNPDHNYLVHNASLPLPSFVKDFPFDLILMNSSFLTPVFDNDRLASLRKEYGFIKDSTAFKIALPQDDYYCSEELDSLVTDWNINLVYTICPDYWDILYPKYISRGGMIKLGYTGYITPEMLSRIGNTKPAIDRKYDVTYRVTANPTFPNKLATLKANIGNIFIGNIAENGLTFNIASGREAMISGVAWWDFIENSRCVIGSMSGSSNLIRNHTVTDKIRQYKKDFPAATDDQIIANCLPPGDADRIYEMLSPRIIEAGLLGAAQLLVEGSYSNVVEPYEHYIPIKGDFLQGGTTICNTNEITEILKDISLQEKIAARCKDTILGTKQLHLSNFFADVFMECRKAARTTMESKRNFAMLKARYDIRMQPVYKAKFLVGNVIHSLKKT